MEKHHGTCTFGMLLSAAMTLLSRMPVLSTQGILLLLLIMRLLGVLSAQRRLSNITTTVVKVSRATLLFVESQD
jgi:hypothetical protein